MRRHIPVLAAVVMVGAAPVVAQREAPHFSARSDLVVLNASVTDGRGHYVGGLPAEAFSVFDEGLPQEVSFFAEQDAPATLGILIDGSGSMVENKDRVVAAITTFALASHPDDQFLPLVFNERVTTVLPPDRQFTDDPMELSTALTRNLNAYGRTAFHDALAAALDGLAASRHERRALVVLSDGGDNASRLTFAEVLAKVQASNVVIYTVALLDPLNRDQNPKALRRLAEATGGLAFEPKRVSAVGAVLGTIAADIRSRYTLAYAPSDGAASGRLRHIRVIAQSPDHRKLRVRARTGYAVPVDTATEVEGCEAQR